MSEKIVLIDGHSIIHRAFYGVPDLTNAEGLHTNGIYGFLNILFRILDEEKPDYLAVAFDLSAPTFRHQMYDAYKGTRKGMPDELREQVPVLKELLQAMDIPLLMKEGYEADDLLGTVARRSEEKGLDTVIVSGDRDLLQIATDKIMIRMPKTRKGVTEIENYYAEDVLRTYQVTPTQIIELKALMGDSSDNIPGVPGIGEKGATGLITAYGNIENAYAHVEEIKQKRTREALREHYDMAVMSKKLATICVDAPITLEMEAARLTNPYTPEAYQWCRKLNFRKYLERFEKAGAQMPKETAPEAKLVREHSEAEAVFEKAGSQDRIAFELSWQKKEDGLTLTLSASGYAMTTAEEELHLSLALSETEVWELVEGGELTAEYLLEKVRQVVEAVPFCAVSDVKKILKYLSPSHPEHFFDIEIGAYLMNPLANHYAHEDIGKPYAALTTWKRASLLLGQLKESGMKRLFYEIEMPLVFTLYDMEKDGIRVNAEELRSYGEALVGRIGELERQIHEAAGETFNINSPKQLGAILFEKLGMQGGKKTKTGYSTSAEVLDRLAPEHPIVKDILEYRQLTKLKSTYADGLAGCIAEDGRIHSNFNQTITATGRISSTEPNLQNIPVRMELGRLIRKVFIPREGCVFVDADYSQIELRVLAHMSGDETLIEAYRQAEDIHRITASQVFHVSFEEVTPLQRRNAKAVNFGIVYGISSFGLSQDLDISKKEAKEYIDRYFETYPGIKGFLDGLVAEAKEKGYVSTMYGRRRPIPELKSSNFAQRSFGERVAMNSPIQGTAADIIKIAMIRVHDRLRDEGLKSRLILQVHDELLIEAYEEEAAQVERILQEEMQQAASLRVALEIDMHRGKNWYEAK
ncbi:MAG: DNA polymerase I [Lachnospiraceae bacterium]|nr:DNA polymerase I [Lachnospiraceae bacterium]